MDNNMRTVKIIGGLGNQMFQYSLLVGLQEAFHEGVYADVSGFKHYSLHNGLELERIFGIKLKVTDVSPMLAKRLTLSRLINQYLPFLCGRNQFEYPDFRFINTIYNNSRKKYYAGYWHHYKYVNSIKDKLLQVYQFETPKDQNNIKAIYDIANEISIGIHVRRGDYLKEKQYQGICTLEYYQHAIEMMKDKLNQVSFYVFSNDLNWCRDNLSPLFGASKTIYVDWNKGDNSFRDMQLMSYCKGLIIANSSFSWWGAFLNQRDGHIVVAPKRWKNAKYDLEIQMPEWIKI